MPIVNTYLTLLKYIRCLLKICIIILYKTRNKQQLDSNFSSESLLTFIAAITTLGIYIELFLDILRQTLLNLEF